MSVFVLVPGAGGAASYWHRVVPELRARGHEAVAVELPGADELAGLPEYANAVANAIGGGLRPALRHRAMAGRAHPGPGRT
jgi:surfactin synthase thioesterase subunit